MSNFSQSVQNYSTKMSSTGEVMNSVSAVDQNKPKTAKQLEKEAKKQAKLEKFQQKEQQKKTVPAENDKIDVSFRINRSF